MNTEILLSAHDLSIGYSDKNSVITTVLKSFSIDIAKNEVVVILGASGTGKSSLLRCLANLQTPISGSLKLLPKTQTAFVFQSPALLPWLSVKENVAFGSDFKNQPKIEMTAIDNILKEVGLSNSINKKTAELSGGMAQRVALARALVRNPAIIFLDEPFAALDALTRFDMQQLLSRVVRLHHASAVMVTHDIDEALFLADRIILLGQGRQLNAWQVYGDEQSKNHIRQEIFTALSIAHDNAQQENTVEFVI